MTLTMGDIIFMGMYFVFTCTGLALMRQGALAGGSLEISFNGGFSFSIGFISLLGYISYLVSFLMFTRLVSMFPLSFVMPVVTGIVQVLSVIIAFAIFKEEMRIINIIGIVLVIAGIVAINLKSAS